MGIVVSVLRRTLKQGNGAANGGAAAAEGAGDDTAVANSAEMYIVDSLLPCQPGTAQAGAAKPAPVGRPFSSSSKGGSGAAAAEGGSSIKQEGGAANGSSGTDGTGKGGSTAELNVVPVLLPLVCQMSSLRVSLPTDLRPPEVRKNLLLVLEVSSSI
jgi:hypothetical protein